MESSGYLLNRLAAVLPIFESAVSPKHGDRDWEFCIKLRSAFTLLLQAVENLRPHFGTQRFRSETECRDKLCTLSQELNNIVSEQSRVKFATSSFPGLEALRKTPFPDGLLPRFEQASHETLIGKLAKWTDEMGNMIPKASERKRPSHDIHDVAITLHSALQSSLQSSKCPCTLPHEALLFMANHRNFSERDNHVIFDMLFTAPMSMGPGWRDSQVKVPVNVPAHRNLLPTEQHLVEPRKRTRFESESESECRPSVNICSHILTFKKLRPIRIGLLAENGELRKDKSTKRARLGADILSAVRVISFREFLDTFKNGPELSLEVLTQLAILLATSFLHHYGGPWIPDGLNSESFRFMKTADETLLIPFLPFVPMEMHELPSMLKVQTRSRLAFGSSLAARVELGVLLLEVFLQESLDIQMSKVKNGGNLMDALTEVVLNIDEHHLERWERDEKFELILDAINACFDLTKEPLGGEFEECESLYQSVIRPLEDKLIQLTNDDTRPVQLDTLVLQESTAYLQLPTALPDSVISTVSHSEPTFLQREPQLQPPINLNMKDVSPSNLKANPLVLKPLSTTSDEPQRVKPEDGVPTHQRDETHGKESEKANSAAIPRDRYITYLEFLVQELKTTKPKVERTRLAQAEAAATWLHDFIKIDARVFQPLIECRPLPRRIRIAILDTGCDLGTGFFEKEHNLQDKSRVIGEHWNDFIQDGSPTSPDPVDEDGHGTKIVTTLLMLLPRVELFIGRVARKAVDFNSEDVYPAISTAILHAANEWEVDIITMSFGFLGRPQSIEEAIDKALGPDMRKKRLLIIAAANNDGRKEPERFPASYRGLVISARGTQSNGHFEGDYNPDGDGGPFYGTLAVEIPCTHHWVKEKKSNKTLTISGCSIAAPIMAAIAATYLQYALWKLGKPGAEKDMGLQLLNRLFEVDGMLALFSQTTQKKGSCRDLEPTQLFDGKGGIERETIWASRLVAAVTTLEQRITSKVVYSNNLGGSLGTSR